MKKQQEEIEKRDNKHWIIIHKDKNRIYNKPYLTLHEAEIDYTYDNLSEKGYVIEEKGWS